MWKILKNPPKIQIFSAQPFWSITRCQNPLHLIICVNTNLAYCLHNICNGPGCMHFHCNKGPLSQFQPQIACKHAFMLKMSGSWNILLWHWVPFFLDILMKTLTLTWNAEMLPLALAWVNQNLPGLWPIPQSHNGIYLDFAHTSGPKSLKISLDLHIHSPQISKFSPDPEP